MLCPAKWKVKSDISIFSTLSELVWYLEESDHDHLLNFLWWPFWKYNFTNSFCDGLYSFNRILFVLLKPKQGFHHPLTPYLPSSFVSMIITALVKKTNCPTAAARDPYTFWRDFGFIFLCCWMIGCKHLHFLMMLYLFWRTHLANLNNNW